MSVSLVTALAKHLNVDDSEAADTLRSVAAELRRALDESERIEIPGVGVFVRGNDGVGFQPDEALLRAANLDTDALNAITLPGRTGVPPIESGPPPLPPESAENAPFPSPLEVHEDLPEFDEEPTERSFFEAEVEPWMEEEAEAVVEAPSEPERPPVSAPPDPVAYWSEEEYDADESDEGTAPFETTDADESDEWQPADAAIAGLGVVAAEDAFEPAEFDVVPPDEPEPIESVHVTQRADRPPERHAHPKEVVEERAPSGRRSLLPILLVGIVLLLGLAAAAYYILLRGPQTPPVAGTERTEAPLADVAPDTASVAGGLADSAVVPATGAPTETVVEAGEVVDAEPEPEPVRPPEPVAAPAAIDVSEGGWTVVVASATTAEQAAQTAARFRSLGYEPAVLYGAYGGVTRYRVAVRQFASEAEAQAFLRGAPDGLPGDAWRLPITPDLEVIPRQE